jgi:hypothetical protein
MRTFLERVRKPVVELLEKSGNVKVHTEVECVMERRNPDDGDSTENKSSFKAKTKLVCDNVDDLYHTVVGEMLRNFIEYQKNGSEWVLRRVERLTIHVIQFEPLSGSSFIPLPEGLKGKRAIVNMKNNDNECFKWSVTRGLNKVKRDHSRVTRVLRKQAEKLDWSMLRFPVAVNDKNIEVFEDMNGIGINIFGYEEHD